MSMMPSYWVGGMGDAGAGLQNAYASQAQTNAWNAQQANTLAQANAFNPFANSGGYFGAQPAYYAGLGAAYGRSTGGFRGGAGYPSGSVQRGPDLPNISPAQNPFINSSSRSRNSIARIMAAGAGDQMGPSGTAGGQTATPHNQAFRMPNVNPDYFNRGMYGGSQGSFGIPYRGQPLPGDVGFSRQPSYPNLGYNPGMQNWFANPGFNPSPWGSGGIGSDMRYGRQNLPDFDQTWHQRTLPLFMPPMPQGPIPPVSPLPQQGSLGYQPTVSS